MSEFNHLFEPLPNTISRRQAIKGLVVTTCGLALGLVDGKTASAQSPLVAQVNTCGGENGSILWQPSDFTTLFNKLAVMIWVGSDDIRSGNHVYVKAFVQPAPFWPELVFQMTNDGQGYPHDSIFKGWISLAAPLWGDFSQKTIRRIRIEHDAGGGDDLSADNWNMNKIVVMSPRTLDDVWPPIEENSPNFDVLFSGSASPYLHRFKKNCQVGDGGPWWEVLNPFRR